MGNKILEEEFGLEKGVIDERMKRSKLDWKEYNTLKEMRKTTVRIPDLKIPSSAETAASAKAFITESKNSPFKRPPSQGSVIFSRKHSHPVLPSSYQAKLPTCREMLR